MSGITVYTEGGHYLEVKCDLQLKLCRDMINLIKFRSNLSAHHLKPDLYEKTDFIPHF